MGENSDKMYCGAGPVPKGKVRGTPEYCVQTNQVRYYGIIAINPNLLKTAKGKTTDLVNEQLKLKKIENDAKILINEVKKLKIILDSKEASRTETKRAQKRFDNLMLKRDSLVKRLKKQQKVVEEIEKAEKEQERAAKKKKSGSKTAKTAKKKR